MFNAPCIMPGKDRNRNKKDQQDRRPSLLEQLMQKLRDEAEQQGMPPSPLSPRDGINSQPQATQNIIDGTAGGL